MPPGLVRLPNGKLVSRGSPEYNAWFKKQQKKTHTDDKDPKNDLPSYSTDPNTASAQNPNPKKPKGQGWSWDKKGHRWVQKKAPIPVPSVTIDYTPDPNFNGSFDPKTGKYKAPKKDYGPAGVGPAPKKPKPHGGHLPVNFLEMGPEDYLSYILGVDSKADRQRIRHNNQMKERNRRNDAAADRAAEAAARRERRAQVAKIDAKARSFIGKDKLDRYVQTGEVQRGIGDVVGAVGAAAFNKAWDIASSTPDYVSHLGDTFDTSLQYGLRGKETGREMDIADDPVFSAIASTLVSSEMVKRQRGEDFNPWIMAGELSLLMIPIKGAPTGITTALRAIVGGSKLLKAERAGWTVAELIKPIGEVKAGRRLALMAQAEKAGRSTQIPSSKLAGALAGNRQGRLARIIRNDVNAVRTFRVGDSEVETAADMSRIGKGARRIMDSIRDSRFVPLRNSETMFARIVGKKTVAAADRYAGVMHQLDQVLPKNWMGKMDWPGVYAVRTVLKGVPIENAIKRTTADLEHAIATDDWLGEQALRVHLANFKAAEKYVDGRYLRHDAPTQLRELRDAIGRVSGERENILKRLDLLSESRAEGRILNEQLHYAQAQAMPKDDWIAQRLAENPTRQKLAAIWKANKKHSKGAEQGLTIQDANARRVYENAVAYADEEIARLTKAVEQHPPGDPLHNRHRIDLARMQAEKEGLDPGRFYDEIKDVEGVLPKEIIDEMSEDYGTFNVDWRFSIFEGDEQLPKQFASDISKAIHDEGLPLPPEIDSHASLAKGIEDVYQLADEGVAGKDWYPIAAEGVMTVSKHTGVPPKQVAQLFAIYSQAADTVANSTFVFDAIRQFQKHGDLFSGRFPVRQSPEALAVLQGGHWEGRKRSSFYANILRHIPGMEEEYAATLKEMEQLRGSVTNPVTVDRWVVRMFSESLGDVPGSYYDTFEKIIQQMAEKLGWEPEQIQAAAWVAMKDRGLQKEMAKSGRTTVRHIAGAEDAFQYGIRRQIEKEIEAEAQGGLFATAKYEVSPAAKRLQNSVNKKWGGFTVDRDLQPIDEEGYVVTLSLTETEFPLHKVTAADIEQFRERYAELLKDKRHVIGGFSDDANEAGDGTEVTYLSISRRFKRKADAVKFGREQGQETIYEYPKVDPKTGKKPKIGDGIRTGLSREEQQQIISDLRASEAIPARLQADPLPTDLEREYSKFLARAAKEFNISRKKIPTENQKAQAEEWFLKHGHEYEDEPIVQEWTAMYEARRPPENDPAWMTESADERLPYATQYVRDEISDGSASSLHASIFDDAGLPTASAEGVLMGKGQVEARKLAGYEEAVTQLERQEIPKDFIEQVVNSPLHIYDKMAIGRHLDSIAGGTLKGREFPDIPGASRMFPDTLQLAGLWEGETRKLYFSDQSHPIDWIHEFAHAMETADVLPPQTKAVIWKHVGAQPGAKLTHDQSEDMADMITATVLGFNPTDSTLPKEVQRALLGVQKAMKASNRKFTREVEMLAALPEDERMFIEDIWRFEDDEGVHFTNGFTPEPGVYVPEKHGLPFKFGNPLAPRRAATHWYRLLANKKITTLTPTDEHLSHAWKGDLIRSGRFNKDIIEGPMEGLLKASQIERMTAVHDQMVAIGFEKPTNVDDVMVPTDPGAWTDDTRAQARSMIDIMEAMDRGDVIDAQQLAKVDAQAIENVKDFMFPGLTDASDITHIVKQAMKEPIPGVVWVPRRLLQKTGLFDGIPERGKGVKSVLYGVDTANNLMKMMTLSLNPAYYPMNMAGQAVMLGSQMTWSAPFSLARSLRQWTRMSEEDLAMADAFAGVGFAGAQFMSKGGVLKGATDAVGKVGTVLIDKYPRRAAFFHEARRLGYKSDADMHRLLNDPDVYDDLFKVHERTGRAMVDYGNLNRFEREAMTRLVFVYPWLRGSSRYAAQFPFDHPIQTAAFAGLIYWQQNRLQEALPDHPGYLKWYLPIQTGDENGQTPYGFRMDQLITPLQTLDLAAMMWYWTGEAAGAPALPWGSNEEGIGSMLGPLAEEIEKTVTGWDSFSQEEVSHGLPQFFMRILDPRERWASWNRLTRIMDHKTHEGIYDTNQLQNWLRLFLGSLAPINVDPEAAAKQSAKKRGSVTPTQARENWAAKVKDATGDEVSEEWLKWKENEQAYDKAYREYRDEHGIVGNTTIQTRLAIILQAVAITRPDLQEWADKTEAQALAMSDEDAQSNYDSLREQLGLRQIAYVDEEVARILGERTQAGATP